MTKAAFKSTTAIMTLWLAASMASAESLPKPDRGGVPESKLYDYGVMGPPATPALVAAADKAVTTPMPKGPFKASWESIAQNYQSPTWFEDAKFGIFIHWGIYSAAAHHNEWYEKHMYAGDAVWHAQNFGPQEQVGYKDLIPQFTAARWNPDNWAALFKASGARFVVPAAQHHDNFALWNSQITPFNAVKMGPHRDLIGDLAVSVRKQGLKFGVSNHGIENFTFVNPTPELDARLKAASADLYDPKWAKFYNVADRSPVAMQGFLTDWLNRNIELIDSYHPDILWLDNGVNLRVLDPLKEHLAAYYYNRALAWHTTVALTAKFVAFAPDNNDQKPIGSVMDFEKVGKRSPSDIRTGPWVVDDTIGSTWGYTDGMTVTDASGIIAKLVDTASKGGTYMLNISPMADGTIPQAQQDTLLGIGKWLDVNGEAIYGTRPWLKFGEGYREGQPETGITGVRFTTRDQNLYAVSLSKPQGELLITSLPLSAGKITGVSLLGGGALAFTQDRKGLHISPPADLTDMPAYSLRITGLAL